MQTRRALLDDKGEDAVLEALDSWKKTITIFDLGERRTKTKDPLTYLIQTANAVGVKLVFLGDFPKEQEIRELAVKIAEERNVALYCGEYGVIDRANPEDTVRWYEAIHAAFTELGIGRAMWTYKALDFGLVGEHYAGVRKDLIALL